VAQLTDQPGSEESMREEEQQMLKDQEKQPVVKENKNEV
jgi:hypothetical protein